MDPRPDALTHGAHDPATADVGPGAALGGQAAFAADDGSVPDEVADALRSWAAGRQGIGQVVTVLARHRLLIPLLEVDGDLLEGDDTDPCAGQDRAVAAVSMRTAEGSIGLAFTGVQPLLAWNPAARPMPVEASRVAQALLADAGIALQVDPAGPHAVHIGGAALRRLATGEQWPQPWTDPEVRDAVIAELGPALAAGDVALRLAEPEGAGTEAAPALGIELRFPDGLPPDVAEDRAAFVAERLAASDALRTVFDGTLAVRIEVSPPAR